MNDLLWGRRFAPDPEAVERAHRRAVFAQRAVVAFVASEIGGSVWTEFRPDVDPGLVDMLLTVALILAGVAWTAWKTAAYRLVPALGGESPERTEIMAVVGYVVPIASLWIPYQMMVEIRDASDPEAVSVSIATSRPVPQWRRGGGSGSALGLRAP